MASHTLRKFPSLCLAALALVCMSAASAQEPAPSLYEKRLGILKGTSKGIVLYAPDTSEPPALPKPNGAKTETGTDAKQPAATTPQAPAKSGLLNALPPPSGRSLDAARRLGTVSGGIPVSTANKAASDTQAEPAAKP